MKVQLELTSKDHKEIANMVISQLAEQEISKKIVEMSAEVAKDKFWHIFEESYSKIDATEVLENFINYRVSKNIKENNLVEKAVKKVINSEDMKKVTAEALRYKARQLEENAKRLYEEAMECEDDDE